MKHNALSRMMQSMLERCAQCARRGPHGEWVLTLDEPRHDHAPGVDQMASVRQGSDFLAAVARACGKAGVASSPFTEVPPAEQCNVRPVSKEWLDQCDKVAEQAARDLQAFVVMLAAQDMGKVGITTGGEGLPGEEIAKIIEMAEDMPEFLRTMADMVEHMVPSGKHAKPKETTVEFMPGCFDEFHGTQEELQEFIAHVRQLAASGEFERQVESGEAIPMTRDQIEELMQRMGTSNKTRQ